MDSQIERGGKNNWIGVIIILVIIIGTFFLVSGKKNDLVKNTPAPVTSKNVKDLALFAPGGLAAAGVEAEEIGFHGFSPDGRYFFFSAFKQGATPANQAYLVKVSDGIVTKLPGFLERGIDDNRIITLRNTNGTSTVYWLATGEAKTYNLGENVYFGSLSPRGTIYVANTSNGIKKVEVDSGVVTNFTLDPYDGAYVWLEDSIRMLGVEGTEEKLSDGAGSARRLGIWDTMTEKFEPLPTTITDKTMRNISWVVPNKIARINTGWDDGSHDYLLNIETKVVVDLGDTSGALMGGVVTDPSRGYVAIVGGDDQTPLGSKVLFYKGMNKVHDLTLPAGYIRQNVQIVDDTNLIYLRKQWGENEMKAQALVRLDLTTGTETVFKELPPQAFTSLSLAPDKKTWVLSLEGEFIVGSL